MSVAFKGGPLFWR